VTFKEGAEPPDEGLMPVASSDTVANRNEWTLEPEAVAGVAEVVDRRIATVSPGGARVDRLSTALRTNRNAVIVRPALVAPLGDEPSTIHVVGDRIAYVSVCVMINNPPSWGPVDHNSFDLMWFVGVDPGMVPVEGVPRCRVGFIGIDLVGVPSRICEGAVLVRPAQLVEPNVPHLRPGVHKHDVAAAVFVRVLRAEHDVPREVQHVGVQPAFRRNVAVAQRRAKSDRRPINRVDIPLLVSVIEVCRRIGFNPGQEEAVTLVPVVRFGRQLNRRIAHSGVLSEGRPRRFLGTDNFDLGATDETLVFPVGPAVLVDRPLVDELDFCRHVLLDGGLASPNLVTTPLVCLDGFGPEQGVAVWCVTQRPTPR